VRTDGRDFLGREAMLARDKPWRMVLLQVDAGNSDPFYSHTVYAGGEPIGIVTSGAFGHRTGKTLALAYLRKPPSSALTVNILGKPCNAEILQQPPYDATNSRTKG
jgi:dimethylglycine dehydrogenase